MGDLSRYDGRKPEPPYPTPDDDLDTLRAQLTEKNREIERMKEELESRPAFFPHGMIESLERQLSVSQAREREAVRTVKIQAEHAGEVEKESLHLESALAAARKALGTAWAAMCERRGYAEAWEWKYSTTWDEEDAEVRAALAPEQKGE